MSSEELPKWVYNPPLLIYGPRKGGTTLLQNLVDGGKSVFVYPAELKLKYLGEATWNCSPATALEEYLSISNIKDIGGLDYAGYSKAFEYPYIENVESLRDLILNDISAVYRNSDHQVPDPSLWAVKEVGGNSEKIIKLWLNLFTNAKVLMITRNPLNVTRAVILDRERKGVRLRFKQVFREVLAPVCVLTKQLKFLGQPGFCFVSYENLTKSPAQEMRNICKCLQIEYDEAMSYPTIFGERVVVATSSKNEMSVFNEKKQWYSGLGIKYTFYVILSMATIRLFNLFRLGNNKWRVESYSKLVCF